MQIFRFFILTVVITQFSCMGAVPAYNETISKTYHSYCIISHCKMDQIQQWSCPLCQKVSPLSNVFYFQDSITNVVGYVGYYKEINRIVIIFRGTEDIKNWIEDFSYQQIQYPRCQNCKVHLGFYSSYLSILQSLDSALNKLEDIHYNKQIVVLGSSLGAAISTIAAL